jgi:hypothetical protein
MHQLAKNDIPSNLIWKRYSWDDQENNTPDRQLSKDDLNIPKIGQSVFTHLQELHKDLDGYGIIHQDAHLGILFIN